MSETENDDRTRPLQPPLSSPNVNITGRVFLITGGTQGLGLEVARTLKHLGARGLVLVSRSEEKAARICQELTATTEEENNKKSQICETKFIRADLSNASEASSVIPRAADAMHSIGPISGVVNAAATTQRGNLFTTTTQSFDDQFALNTRAPFLITQSAAQHMIKQGVKGGSIVNVCSVTSLGGAPFVMAYSASKAALVSLTKCHAAELAPKGIRVNGVNMGWCLTENENKVQTEQEIAAGVVNVGDWVRKADESCPLGRILRPGDVASSIAFLLSDAAMMMTGSILSLHPEFAHGMISLASEDVR